MENNVVVLSSPSSKSPVLFTSPGNNPFDDVWKKTIDIVSASEQVNRRSSIQLSTDFTGSSRKSLSFRDLNSSDFGRESMGILPPDFGRDSLGFMNLSSLELGRESLGILQMNALRESLSFRRESLGILNLQDMGRESLDFGRESLGILNLKSPDFQFGDEQKRVPEIMLTTVEENWAESCNILDTAFLQPHSRRYSGGSSTSSVNPSFNSLSLEGPSRIYSLSSMKNYTQSDMTNYTYSCSSAISSIHSPLNKGKIFSPSELNVRSRIQSLPVTLEENCSLNVKSAFEDVTDRNFWSSDRAIRVKSLDRSFHKVIDFKEAEISNEFQDSVFIEGHIIAEKIADGSILNDSSNGNVGVLDCTPQPEWPDDISYCDKEPQKCDTETIFKTIDKMLPQPVQNILNTKLRISSADDNSSSENEEKINTSVENKHSSSGDENVSKIIQNISDIQHEPKKQPINKKSSKELLENLSELLNSTNRSDKQRSEGHIILNNLAQMLGEGKSNIKDQDDSGHSSINEQSDSPNKVEHECFEVLDLRTKSVHEHSLKENSSDKNVLHLSLKSKVNNVADKRLSQSLCSSNSNKRHISLTEKQNSTCVDVNKNKINLSVTSNDSKNLNNLGKPQISGKLRQKSLSTNVKKGPMKAVIPVGDMKKKRLLMTPEKNEQKFTTMQSKRTSTPINEPKLKPMAASTPTTRPTKETPRSSKARTSTTASKIVKPNSSTHNVTTREKAYSSTCISRSSTATKEIGVRRNSVSDMKTSSNSLHRRNSVEKESGTVTNPLQRRNTVEKGSGIMSSIAKVRSNLAGSPYYQTLKQNSGIQNKLVPDGKGKLGEPRQLPVPKSNMISKHKRPGKENVEK